MPFSPSPDEDTEIHGSNSYNNSLVNLWLAGSDVEPLPVLRDRDVYVLGAGPIYATVA
jgi:hypothetical protein